MAKVSTQLLDATNLLDEAINLLEAGFMAAADVPDRRMRDALRGLLGKAGDIARASSVELSAEIARMREGGDA